VGLEGALRVGLRLERGRIGPISVQSTRPDIARTMLVGRSVAEIQAAVPLLFSVCGHAQTTASRLACAAAAGEAPSDSARAAAQAAIEAETLREHVWHTVLNAARWLGESPAPEAVTAARAAMGWVAHPTAGPASRGIAIAVFGRPAAEWLQVPGWPGLQAWAADGDTAAARYTLSLSAVARPRAERDTAVALLPRPTASSLATLAEALDADAAFTTRPSWGGAPAETGALARLQGGPWFDAAGAAAGSRALGRCGLRFVARLRELAGLLSGQTEPHGPLGLGSLSLGAGLGLGWVDSARGILLHRVRLASGRVSDYRIVAPTDWNFHPHGALTAALEGARVPDRACALALATRVVRALDPCVPGPIEFDDA